MCSITTWMSPPRWRRRGCIINGCRMRCGSSAAFADDTLAALRAKGHEVIEPLGQTSANSIAVTPNGLLGAPDPRTRGAEAAGQ